MEEHDQPEWDSTNKLGSSSESEPKQKVSVGSLDSKHQIPVLPNLIKIDGTHLQVIESNSFYSKVTEDSGSVHVYHAVKSLHKLVQGEDDVQVQLENPSEVRGDDSYEAVPVSDEPSFFTATLKSLNEIQCRLLGDEAGHDNNLQVLKVEVDRHFESDSDDDSTLADEERTDKVNPVEFQGPVKSASLKAKHGTFPSSTPPQIITYKPGNITWPTINRFTKELGVKSIKRYIKRAFILAEAWMYNVVFLVAYSEKVSDYYLYEAKFCIPTSMYPVAQATVSVYFTVEVSRSVPGNVPVRVSFTLESLRRVMVPGEEEVNEGMLLQVLHTKLAVFKRLYF
ncbi:hypothetical protein NQ315_001534 [Exocentrus adspersus]|uniref:Uncharacterized protein n=1 Tax=Exocentrus adspersus TaxID=1586481 RepID=A0AAV8W9U8_9CUCU|nr:hypothetical protein NQ315_001534 [Exocentrus adspersus]